MGASPMTVTIAGEFTLLEEYEIKRVEPPDAVVTDQNGNEIHLPATLPPGTYYYEARRSSIARESE